MHKVIDKNTVSNGLVAENNDYDKRTMACWREVRIRQLGRPPVREAVQSASGDALGRPWRSGSGRVDSRPRPDLGWCGVLTGVRVPREAFAHYANGPAGTGSF
jgi:hypothetical protein